MTYVGLSPTSTTSNSGAVTGAGSAHAALSDGSDSSYVTYDASEISLCGMADLSLPSGALLILAQVFARCAVSSAAPSVASARTVVNAGGNSADVPTTVNWFSPASFGGAMLFGGITDADVDAAACAVGNTSILGTLRVYEMFLRCLYYVKPSVTVDAPSGTIGFNRVSVAWTPSFDAGITPGPSFYEIKIFSAAQYGAGGFDPDSSTATLSTDGWYSAALSTAHEFSSVLPNATYRAYVRVAAGVTPDHVSDWAYGGFVVNAPSPAVPTLGLAAQPVSGSIEVSLTANSGAVSTSFFELERSDDGGVTFESVRTSLGDGLVVPSGVTVVSDFEAPNGVAVTYRARAFNDATPSYSAWVSGSTTWSSDDWWMKHATRPSLNYRIVTLRSYPGESVQSNQGTFRVLGSKFPVVVTDTRGPVTGQIVLMTEDLADREALIATLDAQAPMLLQGPVSAEIAERWVVFGDTGSERIGDKGFIPLADETLSWTEVARPVGPLEE